MFLIVFVKNCMHDSHAIAFCNGFQPYSRRFCRNFYEYRMQLTCVRKFRKPWHSFLPANDDINTKKQHFMAIKNIFR